MDTRNRHNLPFLKMHGLGNDFVVIDARERNIELSNKIISGIADRHFGVGFDQLAVISNGEYDAHLSFYNSDGSESFACGNATRCIARYLMDESSNENLTLTTKHGTIPAVDLGNGVTSVNMGQPQLEWDKVPLSENIQTLELPIEGSPWRGLSCSRDSRSRAGDLPRAGVAPLFRRSGAGVRPRIRSTSFRVIAFPLLRAWA